MISAANITMRFGKTVLFENVSIKFRPGFRYGLIGANGAGKSTFMKIMTGQLEASNGDISIDQGATLGYLRQDHSVFEGHSILETVFMGDDKLWKLHDEREELYSATELTAHQDERIGVIEEEFGEAGGYTMEADAAKLLIGLGFPEEKHSVKIDTLTGGWRLRVLLAQVLFAKPDILLLDEPTNHLDMASIDWLENFLMRYEGTVVVISHDRYFLNTVSTHICDLDYNQMRLFTGNYDDFMITNEMLLDKRQKDAKAKQKKVDDLKGFINRFSANASKARQATSRQKELDKIEMDEFKPSSRVSPFIRFSPAQRLGEKVINATKIGKTYDGITLFDSFSMSIANNEKIGIIGINGVGKTTLLKMLIDRVKPDSGSVEFGETVQISYFPQDPFEMLDPDVSAMEFLSRYAPAGLTTETDIRSALGRMLFKGDDSQKMINVLSGGEKARLVVAAMLMQGGNVLVLDEPTNHLDLESIESLNYALGLVEETVIFVSHDREFLNSLATRILTIDGGKITDYPGNLTEYDAWQAQRKREGKLAN